MAQVRFTAIDRRESALRVLGAVDEKLLGLRLDYLEQFAREIGERSPVDTANYVESHSASDSRTRGMAKTNSHGRPKAPDPDSARSRETERLVAEIQAVGQSSDYVFVRNAAVYASRVESLHAPYTYAKASASRFLAQALRRHQI